MIDTYGLAGIVETAGKLAQEAVRESGELGPDDGIIRYKVSRPKFLFDGYRALFEVSVETSKGAYKVVVGCDVRFTHPSITHRFGKV